MVRSRFMRPSLVRFSMVSVFLLSFVFAAFASAEEIKNEFAAPESDQNDHYVGNVDPDIKTMEYHADKMTEEHLREACSKKGMVRYHGRCMKEKEKTALFEAEILHVEMLLNEAHRLYLDSAPVQVASAFNQTMEFLNKFEGDSRVDERIERKVLIVLGFLHMAADVTMTRMKEEGRTQKWKTKPFDFLEQHVKQDDFSRQVHIPLMRLLAAKIEEFKLHHGEEEFERLMADNNLTDILQKLQ